MIGDETSSFALKLRSRALTLTDTLELTKSWLL